MGLGYFYILQMIIMTKVILYLIQFLVLITFQMQSQELVDENSCVKNKPKVHFKKAGHKIQIQKAYGGNKKVLSKGFNK
jgi:hypothetical protein